MTGIALWTLRILLFVMLAATLLLAAGATWEAISRRTAMRDFPAPGQLVDIGGGRYLHLLCLGDAPGPTVVIEAGAAESSAYFRDIQHAVAGFARVCIYDRTGLGYSPPDATPQTMEDRARDLAALLQAAAVPAPYVLAGHSYGGPIIRLFARDHADLAAGFVFLDAPDETAIFRDSYDEFVRRSLMPSLRKMGVARRMGVLRAAGAVSPRFDMIPPAMSPAARGMVAATEGPTYATAAMEFGSILSPTDRIRTGGFGGSLGSRPVIVITHGIRFPPPYDVLEQGWDEGQARLAALSTNSELLKRPARDRGGVDPPCLAGGAGRNAPVDRHLSSTADARETVTVRYLASARYPSLRISSRRLAVRSKSLASRSPRYNARGSARLEATSFTRRS
jgi:pimeloyl-ACP methyl ester carboxylesterase